MRNNPSKQKPWRQFGLFLTLAAALASTLVACKGADDNKTGEPIECATNPAACSGSPTLIATVPADTQTDVDIAVTPRITFSEPLDANTVNDATIYLNKTSDGSAVASTVTLSANGVAATLAPSNQLENDTAYTLTVDVGVQDLDGNPLTTMAQIGFTTIAGNSGGGVGGGGGGGGGAGGAGPPKVLDTAFSKPDPLVQAQDTSLLDRIVAMVDQAPAGSDIFMAFRIIDYGPFIDRLIVASQRGVNVHVLVNADNFDGSLANGFSKTQVTRLKDGLAGNSELVYCPKKASGSTACLGDHTNQWASMNSKFIIFSELEYAVGESSKNVVVLTSTNMMWWSTKRHNNMVVRREAGGLYAFLEQYWHDLKKNQQNLAYHSAFATVEPRVKTWLSPRPKNAFGNTLLEALGEYESPKIKCTNEANTIRMVVHAWGEGDDGKDILERLNKLQANHCDVHVIINTNGMTQKVKDYINSRANFKYCHYTPDPEIKVDVESSYILIKDANGGGINHNVYTGTSMVGGDNLEHSDVIITRVENNADTYVGFYQNWLFIESQINASTSCNY